MIATFFDFIQPSNITNRVPAISFIPHSKGITELITIAKLIIRCIHFVIEVQKLLMGSIITPKNMFILKHYRFNGFLKCNSKNLLFWSYKTRHSIDTTKKYQKTCLNLRNLMSLSTKNIDMCMVIKLSKAIQNPLRRWLEPSALQAYKAKIMIRRMNTMYKVNVLLLILFSRFSRITTKRKITPEQIYASRVSWMRREPTKYMTNIMKWYLSLKQLWQIIRDRLKYNQNIIYPGMYIRENDYISSQVAHTSRKLNSFLSTFSSSQKSASIKAVSQKQECEVYLHFIQTVTRATQQKSYFTEFTIAFIDRFY